MQFTMKFLALIFGALILATPAYADSPREQLTQMVEQLQKNPADTALREKIIKLAQEIKPAPAVPEEAERHMAYGTAAFTGAKSLADYKESVKEFEQATLAAPWYGDAYFNLGVAQDKAENYEAALRSLNLARLALPDSKDIKALIYQVEYRNKKANSALAAVEQEKKREGEFLKKLDGARFVRRGHSDMYGGFSSDWMDFFEIRGNKVFHGQIIETSNDPNDKIGKIDWDKVSIRAGSKESDGYLITGREFAIPKDDDACQRHQQTCFDEIQTISEDGNKITYRVTIRGKTQEYIYLRGK